MYLEKFCCCCTTRTGSLVIGTLGWLLTLLQLFGAMDPRHEDREDEARRRLIHSLYGDSSSEYQSGYVDHTGMYVKIGYGLVALLVCVLLVVGVYKKDRRYILPWLVLKGFEATLLVILTVILFFFACSHGAGVLFFLVFVCVLVSALQWYFWMCIWSHYKDLNEGPQAMHVAYVPTVNPPPQYTEKQLNMA